MSKTKERTLLLFFSLTCFFIFYLLDQLGFSMESRRIQAYKTVKSFFEFFFILLSLIFANLMVMYNTQTKTTNKIQILNLTKITLGIIFSIFITYLPLSFFAEFDNSNYIYFACHYPIINKISFVIIATVTTLSTAFFLVLLLGCYDIISNSYPAEDQTKPNE